MQTSPSQVLAVMVLLLCGCTTNQPGQEYEIRTDMYNQPSFKHNNDPRPRAEGTVQTKGFLPAVKDSALASHMQNPFVFTRASADTARFLFETYCSVCHGTGAKGDGLVAAKFQVPPDLTTTKYIKLSDGYIYSVIRNGHLIMPPYYENTTSRDRWLIVSHLRSLQTQ
jgi:cytochrome c5